jgi:hypothetical protein
MEQRNVWVLRVHIQYTEVEVPPPSVSTLTNCDTTLISLSPTYL